MYAMKEETTTPAPSATTDGEQSFIHKYNEIISENIGDSNVESDFYERRRRMERMSDPNYLPTVSMTELYDNVYQSTPSLISDLLNAGTYLFVGAPKLGKSFLMAQIGYHVSKGLPLWGNSVKKCTVLYLALEDVYSRLQKRLSHMFGMDSSDSFYLSLTCKQVNDGLEGQLTEFLRQHPDTKLIIIDTLQKIREFGGEKYSYSSDYEIVTKLKQFSDEYGICLLLVHHTRKQSSEDSFDTISGTNGLLGAADGAFVLQKDKRTDNQAILDITGRDQPDQRLYLEFNKQFCIWQLIKTETDLCKEPEDPILEAVAHIITADIHEWAGSASELVERLCLTDIQPNALTRRLNINANRLLSEFGIQYENRKNRYGRKITLSQVRSEIG